jgi:hypothetical protein
MYYKIDRTGYDNERYEEALHPWRLAELASSR